MVGSCSGGSDLNGSAKVLRDHLILDKCLSYVREGNQIHKRDSSAYSVTYYGHMETLVLADLCFSHFDVESCPRQKTCGAGSARMYLLEFLGCDGSRP